MMYTGPGTRWGQCLLEGKMRLNIGLPGPLSTSTNVNGKFIGQGCLGLVLVIFTLSMLCCCAASCQGIADRITGDTNTTEGVSK